MAIIINSSNFRSSSTAKKSPKHLIEYLLKENNNGIHLSNNIGRVKDEMVSNLQDQVKNYNRNSVQHYIMAFCNVGEIDDLKMMSIGLRAMQMLNYTPDDSKHLLTRHTDGRSPHIHFIVYTWQVHHTLTNTAIAPRRIPNNEFERDCKRNKKKLKKQQYDISRALEVEFNLPSDSVMTRSCKEFWMESRLRIKDKMRKSISEAMDKAINGEEFVKYLENESKKIFGEFMTMLEQEGRYRILSRIAGPPELKFYQNKKNELVFVINNFRCGDRKLGVDYSLEAINKALSKNLSNQNEFLLEGLIETNLETKKKDDVVNQELSFSVFELEPVHQLTLSLTQNYEDRMETSKSDLIPLISNLDYYEEKLNRGREEAKQLQQLLIPIILKAQLLLEEEEEEKRKWLFSLEYQDLLKRIKEEELIIKNYYDKMDKEKLELFEKYFKELEMNIAKVKSLEPTNNLLPASEKMGSMMDERIVQEGICRISKTLETYLKSIISHKGDHKNDIENGYSKKVLKKIKSLHSKQSICKSLDLMVNADSTNLHQPKANSVVEKFKRQLILKNKEIYISSIKETFEFQMLVRIMVRIEPSLKFASSISFKSDKIGLSRNDALLLRSLSRLASFSNDIMSMKTDSSATDEKPNKSRYALIANCIADPFEKNRTITIRDQSLLFKYAAVLLRKMYKNKELTKIIGNSTGQQDKVKMTVNNLSAQFELIGVLMLSYGPNETLQGLDKQNKIALSPVNQVRQIPKGNNRGIGF